MVFSGRSTIARAHGHEPPHGGVTGGMPALWLGRAQGPGKGVHIFAVDFHDREGSV